MNRARRLFLTTGLASLSLLIFGGPRAMNKARAMNETEAKSKITPIVKTNDEWKKILSEEQYHVLRKEGTERPFTSPLNDEKRRGTYHCAGCDLELFSSEMKYDSGTGWPSFFDVLPDKIETKTDYWVGYPRTEYHCARCGGHQGHVFKDGPKPTGLRYCNNGVALTFKAEGNEQS